MPEDRVLLTAMANRLRSRMGGPYWCREYYLALRLTEAAIEQLDARELRRSGTPPDQPENSVPPGCNGCGQ